MRGGVRLAQVALKKGAVKMVQGAFGCYMAELAEHYMAAEMAYQPGLMALALPHPPIVVTATLLP